MDVLFEHRIVQNVALSAELLWQAVVETYEANQRNQGMFFPLAFVVLPLAFHQRTASALASKTQPGALYKALADDREITIGLQARMQDMYNRTLKALSVAFDTGLISLDWAASPELVPMRKTQPVRHVTEEARSSFNAAKRIGQAFAEMSMVQITTQLNIRF